MRKPYGNLLNLDASGKAVLRSPNPGAGWLVGAVFRGFADESRREETK
jgi:hypothetical protein